jgi:hypothetical protein
MKAQQEDLNTWYGVKVKGDLYKKLDFSVEPQVRFFENAGRLSSWQTEFDISAEVFKWWEVGSAYRYQVEYTNPEKNEREHRWAAYTKLSFETGALEWNYRAQFQSERVNIYSSPDGHVRNIEHRHKWYFKVKKKKWPVEPSAGIEYFFTIAPAIDKGEWKHRFYVSLEREISKRWSVNLSYKQQEEFNRAQPDRVYIFSFGLEYEPKWLKIRK